jgi:hypothetical protein
VDQEGQRHDRRGRCWGLLPMDPDLTGRRPCSSRLSRSSRKLGARRRSPRMRGCHRCRAERWCGCTQEWHRGKDNRRGHLMGVLPPLARTASMDHGDAHPGRHHQQALRHSTVALSPDVSPSIPQKDEAAQATSPPPWPQTSPPGARHMACGHLKDGQHLVKEPSAIEDTQRHWVHIDNGP